MILYDEIKRKMAAGFQDTQFYGFAFQWRNSAGKILRDQLRNDLTKNAG